MTWVVPPLSIGLTIKEQVIIYYTMLDLWRYEQHFV